jgi:hypothetical protein
MAWLSVIVLLRSAAVDSFSSPPPTPPPGRRPIVLQVANTDPSNGRYQFLNDEGFAESITVDSHGKPLGNLQVGSSGEQLIYLPHPPRLADFSLAFVIVMWFA